MKFGTSHVHRSAHQKDAIFLWTFVTNSLLLLYDNHEMIHQWILTVFCFSTRNGLIQYIFMFNMFTCFIFNTVHSIPWVNPYCTALAPFRVFTLDSAHCYCILMHITKAFPPHWNNMHQWIVHNKTGNMHQSILISCCGETVFNLRSYQLAFLQYIMCYSVLVTLWIHRVQGVRKRRRKKEREAEN